VSGLPYAELSTSPNSGFRSRRHPIANRCVGTLATSPIPSDNVGDVGVEESRFVSHEPTHESLAKYLMSIAPSAPPAPNFTRSDSHTILAAGTNSSQTGQTMCHDQIERNTNKDTDGRASNPCGTALCKALGFLGTAILPDCDAIISGAKRERRFHATRSCTGQNARTRHPLGWGPYAVQYVLARSLILRCIVAGISIRGTCSLIPKISWRRAVLRSSHVHARSMNWDLAFN